MSSGSLKDVTKAINNHLVTPTLPLPDDLLALVQAYLDKHEHIDDSDSQRLQDELLAIHAKDILDKPARYAFFIAVLHTLRPAIKGTQRLLQWWDLMLQPGLAALGEEKGLASVCRLALLDILCYDVDDESKGESELAGASSVFAQKLLLVWLQHVEAASAEADPSASFIEKQIKLVLLEFGRRRPKDFLNIIDAEFVMTRHRTQTLSLLCEFVRYQPPHLHQLLQTPLFNNLIKCLTIDTSTTVVSLAMTALIMFLPHIPQSMAAHLPSLFLIYSRILFWEKERIVTPVAVEDHTDTEKLDVIDASKSEKEWEKLSFSFESADSTVPELLHYFTFLYGLYPINFMSYIRKPQRYLRHANFPGADEIEIEPTEIRQRSEQFRQLHLLHPNFFTMTIDSELTDPNRFMKSEAADVVADCMALCGPLYPEIHNLPRPYVPSRPYHIPQITGDDNADVPEQPLLDKDDDATLAVASAQSSRHNSWRNTPSTVAISPDSSRAPSRLLRKASQTSQSALGSPGLRPQHDSPNIPPHVSLPAVQSPLQDMLSSQKSLKDNLQQSMSNDSEDSCSQNDSSTLHVDSYLQSLAQPIPRSPCLPATMHEPKSNLANLRREIMLLKNDLNFERYLKQQHLSHIGQLRRLHVKEATVEAETQNLINANKSLKTKLEDARRSELQIKKESEKSKMHSKKWEADLSAKLRAIKEEQKKWNTEGEMLRQQLQGSRDDCRALRQLVVDSEARELLSKQKLQSIELDLEELERSRQEVAKLNATLRSYEAKEEEREKARENEEVAYIAVENLQMQLVSRDDELDRIRIDYENQICDLREKVNEAHEAKRAKHPESLQGLLDGALASLRTRYMDLQKSHNKLLKRYADLEKELLLSHGAEDFDEPLLASRARLEDEGGYRTARSGSPMYRGLSTPDTSGSRRPSDVSSPGSAANGSSRSGRIALPPRAETAPMSKESSGGSTTPGTVRPLGFDGYSSPFVQSHGTVVAEASDGDAKKRAPSGLRYYGRGGIQNSGSKREKKEEKKKGGGIRGIRGFV